jgi:ribosome-binding factor A
MASKTERVQSIITRSLAEIIQFKVKDPRLGFVSIPEVKVSNDFSHAKIYVSFLKDEDILPGMEVLEKSKGFIRSELAKRLDIRRVPELSFELDETYKKAKELEDLINK